MPQAFQRALVAMLNMRVVGDGNNASILLRPVRQDQTMLKKVCFARSGIRLWLCVRTVHIATLIADDRSASALNTFLGVLQGPPAHRSNSNHANPPDRNKHCRPAPSFPAPSRLPGCLGKKLRISHCSAHRDETWLVIASLACCRRTCGIPSLTEPFLKQVPKQPTV